MQLSKDWISRLGAVLSVLGLIGIPAIFLPFESCVSPWGAIELSHEYEEWGFFLMAAPFLLPVPISAAALVVSFSGELPRYVSRAGHTLAVVSVCFTLGQTPCWLASGEFDAQDVTTWISFGLSFTVLLVGGVTLRGNRHRGVASSENAIAAMQVAYSAAAAFPLVVFFGGEGFLSTGWQIGAYVTLATVLIYLAHVAFVAVAANKTVTRPDFILGVSGYLR